MRYVRPILVALFAAALPAQPPGLLSLNYYVLISGTSGAGIAAGVGNSGAVNTSTGQMFARTGTSGVLTPTQPAGTWASWSPTGTRVCNSVIMPNPCWLAGVEFDIIRDLATTDAQGNVVYSDMFVTGCALETQWGPARLSEINHHCIFDIRAPGATYTPIPTFWCGPELTDFWLPPGVSPPPGTTTYAVNLSGVELGPQANNYHWWDPVTPGNGGTNAWAQVAPPNAYYPNPPLQASAQLYLRVSLWYQTTAPSQAVGLWFPAWNPQITVPASTGWGTTLSQVTGSQVTAPAAGTIVALIGHVHDHCESFSFDHGGATILTQSPKNLVTAWAAHETPGYTGVAWPWHRESYFGQPTGFTGNANQTPVQNPGHLAVKGLTAYYPNPTISVQAGDAFIMRGNFYNPHTAPIDNMLIMAAYVY